jgi:hypothetical protein
MKKNKPRKEPVQVVKKKVKPKKKISTVKKKSTVNGSANQEVKKTATVKKKKRKKPFKNAFKPLAPTPMQKLKKIVEPIPMVLIYMGNCTELAYEVSGKVFVLKFSLTDRVLLACGPDGKNCYLIRGAERGRSELKPEGALMVQAKKTFESYSFKKGVSEKSLSIVENMTEFGKPHHIRYVSDRETGRPAEYFHDFGSKSHLVTPKIMGKKFVAAIIGVDVGPRGIRG